MRRALGVWLAFGEPVRGRAGAPGWISGNFACIGCGRCGISARRERSLPPTTQPVGAPAPASMASTASTAPGGDAAGGAAAPELRCDELPSPAPLQSSASPATVEEGRKSRQKKRVGFGSVQVFEHEPRLMKDRLPEEGPGVGLGELTAVSLRRVASFDLEREAQREGVRYLGADERRCALVGLSRRESIEGAEHEDETVKRQRLESVREVLHDEPRAAPLTSLARPPAEAAGAATLEEELDMGPALHDLFCL